MEISRTLTFKNIIMKLSVQKNSKRSRFKNPFRFLGLLVLLFSLISLTSCRRDDDPADNDFFAGTYNGSIYYNDGTTSISKDNGSVFVTKIASGTKYNFRFSDGIPDLNGVEFEKTGDNTLVMVGSSATS